MTETDAAVSAERVPEGFGGWLIVPIIGLVVTPLRAVFHLADYGELFASTDQRSLHPDALTRAGTDSQKFLS